MSSQFGRSCPNSSELVQSQERKRGLDKSARVGTSGEEFAETLDGRIGVVGQQRGALLARGSTVKLKKPNDE